MATSCSGLKTMNGRFAKSRPTFPEQKINTSSDSAISILILLGSGCGIMHDKTNF